MVSLMHMHQILLNTVLFTLAIKECLLASKKQLNTFWQNYESYMFTQLKRVAWHLWNFKKVFHKYKIWLPNKWKVCIREFLGRERSNPSSDKSSLWFAPYKNARRKNLVRNKISWQNLENRSSIQLNTVGTSTTFCGLPGPEASLSTASKFACR